MYPFSVCAVSRQQQALLKDYFKLLFSPNRGSFQCPIVFLFMIHLLLAIKSPYKLLNTVDCIWDLFNLFGDINAWLKNSHSHQTVCSRDILPHLYETATLCIAFFVTKVKLFKFSTPTKDYMKKDGWYDSSTKVKPQYLHPQAWQLHCFCSHQIAHLWWFEFVSVHQWAKFKTDFNSYLYHAGSRWC